jgi:hypothetical protein
MTNASATDNIPYHAIFFKILLSFLPHSFMKLNLNNCLIEIKYWSQLNTEAGLHVHY